MGERCGAAPAAAPNAGRRQLRRIRTEIAGRSRGHNEPIGSGPQEGVPYRKSMGRGVICSSAPKAFAAHRNSESSAMSLENKSLANVSPANVPIASTSLANPSIPRRDILAGMAALGWCGFAPRARAAQSNARPLAAYADALRYGDLDDATIEA